MIQLIPLLAETPETIAFFMAFAGIGLGWYLIFVCERSDFLLMTFGMAMGIFGLTLYLFLEHPDWTPDALTTDTLLSIVLVMLTIIGFLTTLFVWKLYDLKPPHKRFLELAIRYYERLSIALYALRRR